MYQVFKGMSLFSRLRMKSIEEKDNAYGAFSKDYIMTDEVLGSGTYAEVRKAINKKTREMVAVKIIDKTGLSPRELKGLEKEVNILKNLKHKNVVRVYNHYEEEDTLYLVMEYVRGGELFTKIVNEANEFTEATVQRIIRTLAEALKHCNDRGVIHRDIKPQNLLLTTKEEGAELKLADFNLSIQLDPEVSKFTVLQTMCGTPNYVAPEILSQRPYDYKCDIWSLGVITFLLLSGGYLPFFVDEEGEEGKELLLQKVRRGRWSFYPPEAWANVSDTAKDFLLQVMEKNPDKRLDYEGILAHEWMKPSAAAAGTAKISLESLQDKHFRRQLKCAGKVFQAAEIFGEIMNENKPPVLKQEPSIFGFEVMLK